jgi:two-component system cell cycle sensor histidine kinase/response regulator CckA
MLSRREVVTPQIVDVAALVRDLERLLNRTLSERVALRISCGPNVVPVLIDPAQLEQVLVNLAVNARDAMPEGGTLSIAVTGVDGGVRITVADDGMGMPPDVRERAFEPFFTTKEAGEGTGLGLATVHGIVTQSGGEVHVYSEPDLGTSFKVYLPITGQVPVPVEPERSDGDRLRGTETVLLCEDEEGVRHLVEHVLTTHGYRVLAAAGPMQALELAAEQRIDVLVSDVIMPDLSGPELARRLESLQPGVRTLFVSGYTAETVRDRGRLPAGSAFLEKPFDQLSLLRAVATVTSPARRPLP